MKTKNLAHNEHWDCNEPEDAYAPRYRSIIQEAYELELLEYSADAVSVVNLPFFVPVEKLTDFIDFVSDRAVEAV